MKVLKCGSLKKTSTRTAIIECSRCGTVMEVTEKDLIKREKTPDGKGFIKCAFCDNEISISNSEFK